MVGLFVVGAPALVCAQDGPADEGESSEGSEAQRARELFLRGDRLYAEGRYDEAVVAFQESFDMSGRPELLFNLANAYERLNRLEEALAALREYVPYAPPYDQATIERRMVNLQERLDELQGPPAESVEVSDESGSGPRPETSVVQEEPSLIGPIVVLGSGAAAAIAAGVLAGLSASSSSSADEACVDASGRTLCPSTVEGEVSDAGSLALGADIAGAVSAALLAGGVVWLIAELSGGDSEEVPVAVELTPERASFALVRRF